MISYNIANIDNSWKSGFCHENIDIIPNGNKWKYMAKILMFVQEIGKWNEWLCLHASAEKWLDHP